MVVRSSLLSVTANPAWMASTTLSADAFLRLYGWVGGRVRRAVGHLLCSHGRVLFAAAAAGFDAVVVCRCFVVVVLDILFISGAAFHGVLWFSLWGF